MRFTVPALLALPALLSGCAEDPITYSVPTVEIVAPLAGQSVSGLVDIEVEAGGDLAIVRVFFAVDDVEIGEDEQAPYVFEWDTAGWADGAAHSIQAAAEDDGGNVGLAESVVVIVTAP